METNKLHRWAILMSSIAILSTFVFLACQDDGVVSNPVDVVLAKQGDKVEVCHITGNGTSVKINVSQNAVPAHLAHGDKIGDCETQTEDDGDNDGVPDAEDNCPATPNPGQEDCDKNGTGDACEKGRIDRDSDGVADACDNCPDTSNPGQEDGDGDGTGDACEAPKDPPKPGK